MMHVTYHERSPGTWRIRIELGRNAAGKRLFRYETLHGDEETAQRRRFEILAAHENGSFAAPEKLTLDAYLDQWIKNRTALGHLRRSSVVNYEMMVKAYLSPALGGTRLQNVRGADIQALYTKLLTEPGRHGRRRKSATVAHLHRLLVTAFKAARKARLITVNPMEEVDPPHVPKPAPKALGAADVAKLLCALAGNWKEPIVTLAFATGLRRGEVLGLRWKDVDLDRAYLHVRGQLTGASGAPAEWTPPKTESGLRTVSLPAAAVNMLRWLRIEAGQARLKLGLGGGLDDAYVFTSDGVAPIKPNTLTAGVSDVCAAIGLLGFTFHGTRHTHLTALLRAMGEAGAKAVAQRAGHASVLTTLTTYQRVFESDDRALADMAGNLLFGVQNVPKTGQKKT